MDSRLFVQKHQFYLPDREEFRREIGNILAHSENLSKTSAPSGGEQEFIEGNIFKIIMRWINRKLFLTQTARLQVKRLEN